MAAASRSGTGLGVGTGILLHVTYSLLGLGLLIRASPVLVQRGEYAGAAYIACSACRRCAPGRARIRPSPVDAAEPVVPSTRSAFVAGFLTNALNPKATLFFVSLFVLIVNPQTPKIIQAAYGVWMTLATMAWFSLVAVVFTRDDVAGAFSATVTGSIGRSASCSSALRLHSC